MPRRSAALSDFWESILVDQDSYSSTCSNHVDMQVQNDKYESESVVQRTASEGSTSKKTTYSNPHACLVIIDQDNAKTHRCCHPVIRKLHNPTAPTNIRRQSPDRSVFFDTPPMVKARSRWGNSSALADSMTARSSPKVIQRRHRQQQQQQQQQELS